MATRKNTGSSKAAPKKKKHPARVTGPVPRIPVTEVFPVIEDGLWPAKAVEGESFPVRATVFREGHDAYAAEAVLTNPNGTDTMRARMHEIGIGLDRFEAWLLPKRPGDWTFRVESWSDPYTTWLHDAGIKIPAGIDVEVTLAEGAKVLERAIAGEAIQNPTQKPLPAAAAKTLRAAIKKLTDTTLTPEKRLAAGTKQQVVRVFNDYPLRDLIGASRAYKLQVDRERALTGAWYEFFPRSIGAHKTGDGEWVSGTLRTAAADLDRIAGMGFNVVYLTPIHPIGTTFRKGRNNTLTAEPGDPGSPYGIGSAAGGHDAIHPDLGDFSDFDWFVAQARDRDMEVALDIALQCSPDHPWVTEHPEWFKRRADGSIAYAENPPKKYQDIYPLSFDEDPEGLYRAIKAVLELWIKHGVTIFRVDNPHTKPVEFWQRLLAQMHVEHPQVLFLAEAFTRPAMMRTLAEVGFHQSYTYFAWRNNPWELGEYLRELAEDTAHFLRPTFWPTTHDILTQVMVDGGENAYLMRAVLAATGSPTWGIYSGYELVENVQRPGFEEAIDNEKYEFKPREYDSIRAVAISKMLQTLNRARAEHPALQRLRNLTIHETTHDNVLCFSKHLDAWESPNGHSDTVIVLVNMNPHWRATGEVHLDLSKLGIPAPGANSGWAVMRVRDLLDGQVYDWGARNYFDLDPALRVAHVFAVENL